MIEQSYLEEYKDADWMETSTGRKFWPARPRIQDITVFDIAHALAMKCRYNGHSRKFYSVAEHCVLLSGYARYLGLPVETQYHLLMHDANEAYLPDVPRPIKHFFPDLLKMEHQLDAMIREWAGLGPVVPHVVKELDSRVIKDERAQVMGPSDNSWKTDALQALGIAIPAHGPSEAERMFLNAFQLVGSEHLKRPTLLVFGPGEFKSHVDGGPAYEDTPGLLAGQPDVRLVDLLGKCALIVEDGPFGPDARYIDGDFEVFFGGKFKQHFEG